MNNFFYFLYIKVNFLSSSETIEYHKMVWTLAFRIIEVALPINSVLKKNFIKVFFFLIELILNFIFSWFAVYLLIHELSHGKRNY